MVEVSKMDIVEKIMFLEDKFGKLANYKILDPFEVNCSSIISIQKAARIIGDFVGLQSITFNVAVAKQAENTSGHINLDNNDFSFIELDADVINDSSVTLSVLAHEISHKYIHFHGINRYKGEFNEMDNEVLTDLTAIYLGLGKLLLNGCEKIINGYTDDYKSKRITTKHFGYLKKGNYAFAYNLVCVMRNIPFNTKTELLNEDILTVVNQSQSLYEAQYLNYKFHDSNIGVDKYNKIMTSTKNAQAELMEIEKSNIILEKYIEEKRAFLKITHKYLNDILKPAKESFENDEVNPHLRFLNVLKLRNDFYYVERKVTQLKDNSKKQKKQISRLLKLLIKNKSDNHVLDNTTKIICFNCGYTKTVNINIAGKSIKCPNCKYEFYYEMPKINLKKGNRILGKFINKIMKRNGN